MINLLKWSLNAYPKIARQVDHRLQIVRYYLPILIHFIKNITKKQDIPIKQILPIYRILLKI